MSHTAVHECVICGAEVVEEEGTEWGKITWENGDPTDWFCNEDHAYEFMATHNVVYMEPNAQPDVP